MGITKIYLSGILLSLIISCNSTTNSRKQIYCGYELSEPEYAELRTKVESPESPYDADTLWHIYDQLNNSIRSNMPDSVEFEIFLSLLNNDEVGLDIYVPPNSKFFEKIGCAIMNSNYTGRMPEQRYMFLYTYTNDDGSGEIPLEVAIKRKK